MLKGDRAISSPAASAVERRRKRNHAARNTKPAEELSRKPWTMRKVRYSSIPREICAASRIE